MSQINFIPLTTNHFELLLEWLNSPEVQQWWDSGTHWTLDLVQKKYGTYVDGYKIVHQSAPIEKSIAKPISAFIIMVDAQPIGYIQLYNTHDFPREYDETLNELPPLLAALDIFIGEKSALGKGLGTLILQKFLKEFVDPYYDACLVDPDSSNIRAIRAYEKAGFKEIKIINNGIITWMLRNRHE